tara:strand:- start:7959 stop:9452 length:1494 start_codon:yes stop_codon:yes gene_type:complete
MSEPVELSENEQIANRREKLATIRTERNAYPNDFRREHLIENVVAEYDGKTKEELEGTRVAVTIAGRMMTRRIMGKASFANIQDMSGRMQIYIARDDLPEGVYADFKKWDIGDIIGFEGYLFRTKTDELTVRVTAISLLTKALRPLPDKWHGLVDQEQRYRHRYVDLIVNQDTRDTFKKRSAIVNGVRQYLTTHTFMEVETPMMQVMAGGAAAKPFVTHHNALDMELFLRIAPELYLKRLVVGGFERVFEINRNFRNEGLSTRHSPEFTMVEWYQAYADYEDGMNITEGLFKYIATDVLGNAKVECQGETFDFSQPFNRISVVDSILQHNSDVTMDDLNDLTKARAYAEKLGVHIKDSYGLGKIQIEIFEKTVEEKLIQPTFITAYPAEVSPLARRNDNDPFITDRFELFIGGREIANGFSELNDPEDQAERFKAQMDAKADGDDEAMPFDDDYINALEHGMPPTCGVGVGIDRLVMLFTDSSSIRDVILFPHMRKQ